MARRLSDKALMNLILFFGVTSWFLGKKALEGASPVADDPVLRALRAAS